MQAPNFAAATHLHMAVVGQTTGYVSVAFASQAGVMLGADTVLGFVSTQQFGRRVHLDIDCASTAA
jgi:hypothetical protein